MRPEARACGWNEEAGSRRLEAESPRSPHFFFPEHPSDFLLTFLHLYLSVCAALPVAGLSGQSLAGELQQNPAIGERASHRGAVCGQASADDSPSCSRTKRVISMGTPIDLLVANAGRGLGHAFVEQDVAAWRRVIDTNVTGTTYLLQKVAKKMADRGEGRILITGSIAGLIPGSYQAVYNGTKAYLDSFSYALREELSDTGVTVTVLMPGPTDTEFFRRANMLDTPVGKDDSKEDPAKTAQNGWDAVMGGSAHVVSGAKNKIQAALSHITPDSMLARQHTKMAKPEE